MIKSLGKLLKKDKAKSCTDETEHLFSSDDGKFDEILTRFDEDKSMSEEDLSIIEDSMLLYEIAKITKFSKKVQLEAVKRNAHALQFFMDCDDDVKIAAIMKDSSAIIWCSNRADGRISKRVYNEFITHNKHPFRSRMYIDTSSYD